jgi:hypothetical protein
MSTNEDTLMEDATARSKLGRLLGRMVGEEKITDNAYDQLFSWVQAASATPQVAPTAQMSGRGGGQGGAAGASADVAAAAGSDGSTRDAKRAPNWWPAGADGSGSVAHAAVRAAVKQCSPKEVPPLPDCTLLKKQGMLKQWKAALRDYHGQLVTGLNHSSFKHHSHDARGLKSSIECNTCAAKFRLVAEEEGTKYVFVKWECTLLDEDDGKLKKPLADQLAHKLQCQGAPACPPSARPPPCHNMSSACDVPLHLLLPQFPKQKTLARARGQQRRRRMGPR